MPAQAKIKIVKASENNLKNISLEIPKYKLVVVTGVSGSGKSSLVYDVIFREAENRYMSSFSSHARQFMGKMKRPDVEKIEGLSPAIAVNQKSVVKNPRSTVGTLTGIYDYLRLIFARMGKPAQKYYNLKIDRNLFSFNHPSGACENCKGLGVEDRIDPDLLIADPGKSLRQGALVITTPSGYIIYSQVTMDVLNQVCKAEGFNVDIPWQDLTQDEQNIVLYGSDKIEVPFGKHTLESRMRWSGITAKPRDMGYYKGILPVMEDILKRDRNKNILRFTRSEICPVCQGSRLNEKAMSVIWQGKNIAEFASMDLNLLGNELSAIKKDNPVAEASNLIIDKILERISLLNKLGVSYLSPARVSTTLSGGEAQRLRLATQVNSGLREVLYVFDEPSIGLHPTENRKMIEVLKALRDKGNTVVVVEHEDDFISHADHIIDIGPEAGLRGGEILINNAVADLKHQKVRSKTLDFLKGRNSFSLSEKKLKDSGSLIIEGAREHNLRNIDVHFKKGELNLVCGVSGAGKSSLVENILGRFMQRALHGSRIRPGKFKKIYGWENIKKVVSIDQSPIGRTPRSNPATYTKLFDLVRELFAGQTAAKERGWGKGRFSFNVKGGRCETCQGAGYQQVGMHFMGNVEIICEQCNGMRFNRETLEIQYREKNIYEILELSVEEAISFFANEKKLLRILHTLDDLGLGYIKLGQRSTTLSGGEAQRVKLASELSRASSLHTLYLLDEPTTGLHNADVKVLLKSLQNLVKKQNTVILIEHHLGLIASADHIVDLGPGSGKEGGRLVASGRPEEVMENPESLSGKALKEFLQHDSSFTADKNKILQKKPYIDLQGLKTNNLKNIALRIPHQKLNVLTGISGSGKSSLAFDTLYAEGRNRFLESYSAYVRNRIGMISSADFDEINGLTPTMAIKRMSMRGMSRSTVGTITGIYELYRLLFARIATSATGKEKAYASMFSFNHEQGACQHCDGLGYTMVCDSRKLITNPERPLIAGAMDGTKTGGFYGDPFGQYVHTLVAAGKERNIDFSEPWNELSAMARNIAMQGTGDKIYKVNWKYKRGKRSGEHHFEGKWPGFEKLVEAEYVRKHQDQRGEQMMRVMKKEQCHACKGARLNERALSYEILHTNIAGLSRLTMRDAISFFRSFDKKITEASTLKISKQLREEILRKLEYLCRLGLEYLQISREAESLSGGEAQRLRLAAQLTNGLTGMTYVLDEPSIGLHASDLDELISILHELKEMGNTLLVVEHDPKIIMQADHLIEMGPGAGRAGGEIIASGKLQEVRENPQSLAARYLHAEFQPPPGKLLSFPGIRIKEAFANNLDIPELQIPLGGIVGITGVSGSGKSSLLFKVISASARNRQPEGCLQIEGLESFTQVLEVTQTALITSHTSNAATITGIFDRIREMFAKTEQAREQKLKKSHFSFNTKGGRCENCQGKGYINISLDFLTDVTVLCEECKGKRYQDNTLQCKIHGKNIHEVLEMTIREAAAFFKSQGKIEDALQLLQEVGLGYIQLGQPTESLSGGETQRLKIARELMKQEKGKKLFLFDEPGTGLHAADIVVLMKLFRKLLASGHSIMLIEHDPGIIAQCHWVIDLGPAGGDRGGKVIGEGKPTEIALNSNSLTGKVIKDYLRV
ncbi:MAG: excinuclease ABC subunit UvrA [Bacteroidales bacterium]|nr:excinuclease ABC subunit UvrA [Bacteroidales bacterium]MCF8386787.1 excinuclease ABC subunit UvrA [Bacteroidales bacterium]MCF8398234.1 excinuclease ABC subunit UvrA [Bacteroidales bacterium]